MISRLGISVLPPLHPTSPSPILRNGRNLSSPLFTSSRPSSPLSSPLNFRKSSSLSEHLKCSDHFYNVDSYCYSCNKQLCKECLLDAHMLHHTGTCVNPVSGGGRKCSLSGGLPPARNRVKKYLQNLVSNQIYIYFKIPGTI